VAKGLETTTSRNAKNAATPPSTGVVQATRSGALRRLSQTAAAENPVRIRSQRRSEPSWPPQNADSLYIVGSARAVWSATYVNEKSCRRSAAARIPDASSVVPKAASSAFWAESASRRRRRHAAYAPAKAA